MSRSSPEFEKRYGELGHVWGQPWLEDSFTYPGARGFLVRKCTKQTCVLGGPLWCQQCEDKKLVQEELVQVLAHRPPQEPVHLGLRLSLLHSLRVFSATLGGGGARALHFTDDKTEALRGFSGVQAGGGGEGWDQGRSSPCVAPTIVPTDPPQAGQEAPPPSPAPQLAPQRPTPPRRTTWPRKGRSEPAAGRLASGLHQQAAGSRSRAHLCLVLLVVTGGGGQAPRGEGCWAEGKLRPRTGERGGLGVCHQLAPAFSS